MYMKLLQNGPILLCGCNGVKLLHKYLPPQNGSIEFFQLGRYTYPVGKKYFPSREK